MTIPWSELVSVHATKFDAVTHSVTILELEHVCGETIEVCTDEEGFDLVRQELADRLPIPVDWYERLLRMNTGETITLLERRE